MELIHAELPDGQRLQHRALTAVVAPNEQVELGELVGLLVHAFEIAQGQFSDHACSHILAGTPGTLASLIRFLRSSGHLENFRYFVTEVVYNLDGDAAGLGLVERPRGVAVESGPGVLVSFGWSTPEGPAIWFAEIFPSLVRYPEWTAEYESRRDRTQVQSCVRYAAERDSAGMLQGDFAKPGTLDAVTLARVEDEEGWILWV
jgi:hypothetical protein